MFVCPVSGWAKRHDRDPIRTRRRRHARRPSMCRCRRLRRRAGQDSPRWPAHCARARRWSTAMFRANRKSHVNFRVRRRMLGLYPGAAVATAHRSESKPSETSTSRWSRGRLLGIPSWHRALQPPPTPSPRLPRSAAAAAAAAVVVAAAAAVKRRGSRVPALRPNTTESSRRFTPTPTPNTDRPLEPRLISRTTTTTTITITTTTTIIIIIRITLAK